MSPLAKNTIREILRSPGRFLAILAIIVLGSGFFVGLRVSREAMTATANTYFDKTAFYDFAVSTTLGVTGEDVEAFLEEPTILDAEGSFNRDAIVSAGSGETEVVYSFYSLPERINVPDLTEGRFPVSPDECLADSWSGLMLGDKVRVSDSNSADTLELFTRREFTVVGIATSPLYLNYERGSTSIGTGSVSGFCYILPEVFDADYYTTLYLRCADMPRAYTDAYDARADALEPILTELSEARAEIRYNAIINEATSLLNEGVAEYEEALAEYTSQRQDAEVELRDAFEELENARLALEDALSELQAGEDAYQEGLTLYEDGLRAFNEGVAEYNKNLRDYEDGEKAYADGLALYEEGLAAYNEGLKQLEASDPELEAARRTLESSEQSLNTFLTVLARAMNALNPDDPYRDTDALIEALRNGEPAPTEAVNLVLAVISAYDSAMPGSAGELLEAIDALEEGWAAYYDGLGAYDEGLRELQDAKSELDDALVELRVNRIVLDNAKEQLAEAQKTITDGQKELDSSKRSLADARGSLDSGWDAYHEELRSYEEGLSEYEDGLAEVDREFADAEAKLADAWQELEDARAEIDAIAFPTTYVLGRWANVGYVCFESDSNIVRSISTVFPLFFFLVAALICITTVSRMVEEQRTQLGVLMALGYRRGAVMSKFLIYSGSATVIGCLTGILAGSGLMPLVVWQAYRIMYAFSDTIQFYFDWTLSAVTFGAYLLTMLLVTWSSCRKAIHDTPANVIRPRAPKSGKRVLLERIPFVWNRLSFLWKVTVRNIFRYKQRVFMMILGLAGCTALMITGMGIEDSIHPVVDYQFEEISFYDFTVNFSGALSAGEQAAFLADTKEIASGVLFLRQASFTASVGHSEKEANLAVVPVGETEAIGQFMDFHHGSALLPFPGKGEALVSSGLAKDLGLDAGDTFSLRDDNGTPMLLTVSGVYDNYIYNYVYIGSDTYAAGFGEEPEINYALVLKAEDVDVSAATAKLLSLDGVLSASASEDLRERIGSMMESLRYIVLMTIVCAAALAFVVIYNLTNINITERLREIATVKVLGFYDVESALYVLRENLILMVLGAAAGIPLGLALNAYVIAQIDIDLISFSPRVTLMSYLTAIALTFLFSLLVDVMMYFRLNRINTAEALKAAE